MPQSFNKASPASNGSFSILFSEFCAATYVYLNAKHDNSKRKKKYSPMDKNSGKENKICKQKSTVLCPFFYPVNC